MPKPAIVLIPGLGADRDLFYPQQEHFGDQLHVVDDPGDELVWQQQPSMRTAAEAFLNRIFGLLGPDQSYILGGMSFGGSLAVEITRLIAQDNSFHSPAALILIASNRTSDSISRAFRFNRAIGSTLPRGLVRHSLRGLSGLFSKREGLAEDDRTRLREMATRANIDRLMWGAKAISHWSCRDRETKSLDIPIHQIHGRHDWVIPICNQHVTSTLENGRHLITWTHRDDVNEWLSTLTSTYSTTPV